MWVFRVIDWYYSLAKRYGRKVTFPLRCAALSFVSTSVLWLASFGGPSRRYPNAIAHPLNVGEAVACFFILFVACSIPVAVFDFVIWRGKD